MQRWLVTGGVGFIGYHVSRALLLRGDEVVVLDDFSDAPYPIADKRRNHADLEEAFDKLELVEACVTDRKLVERVVHDVNGVIHLAGLAGVRPSFRDPARYARVNVEGTANILESARACGIRKFVFASSSSVYGNSTPLPAREDAHAIVPASPYAASKRAAELIASAICLHDPQVSCAALRFFTVYGPRQRPEMAITTFARALLRNAPITMFGDGSMRRDFTHVDDIVAGILACADRPKPGYREYNLGSGAPVDLNQLIELLFEATGARVTVNSAPVPLGDVEATFADIRRARDELGWSPTIRLTDGLKTVVDWLHANP